MKEVILIIGITLILIGFTLINTYFITENINKDKVKEYKNITNSTKNSNFEKSKIFIGGFIGPIPFGFSNDKEFLKISLTLILITLIITLTILNLIKLK